ncbi:MAG TPA: GntR family transcriptional regulator [Casimicrobiaceae bacterium]
MAAARNSTTTAATSAASHRLARQILELLHENDLAAGSHVGEAWLAAHLRVSRTPVRAALKLLEQMGLLETRRHRGAFLVKPARELVVGGASHQDDDDALYLSVAEDRVSGRLPARFTDAELARRYGLTRLGVGRLLRRMMQEGWVERLPGRGWEFLPVLESPKAYDQMYRFRMLIEPAAVLQPSYRLSRQTIARCRKEQQAMLGGGILQYASSETFRIGSTFHETIVAGSGDPFLIESIRRVNRLRRLMDYRAHVSRARLVRQCKDHLVILDMIEHGDVQRAADFLRRHIDRARREKVRLTEPKQGSTMQWPAWRPTANTTS